MVLFLVSLIVFFSLRLLPGDPALIYVSAAVGRVRASPRRRLDEVRHEYGLDKPVPVQYVNWVKGVVTGDLGKSIRYHAGCRQALLQRFPSL